MSVKATVGSIREADRIFVQINDHNLYVEITKDEACRLIKEELPYFHLWFLEPFEDKGVGNFFLY